jgi:hypothetical protein
VKVVVNVDRVILHGLPLTAAQLPGLRAALEGELLRLFRSVDTRRLGRGGDAGRVLAPSFTYRPQQGSAQIGRQAARAVHSAAHGGVTS